MDAPSADGDWRRGGHTSMEDGNAGLLNRIILYIVAGAAKGNPNWTHSACFNWSPEPE